MILQMLLASYLGGLLGNNHIKCEGRVTTDLTVTGFKWVGNENAEMNCDAGFNTGKKLLCFSLYSTYHEIILNLCEYLL